MGIGYPTDVESRFDHEHRLNGAAGKRVDALEAEFADAFGAGDFAAATSKAVDVLLALDLIDRHVHLGEILAWAAAIAYCRELLSGVA